LSTPCTDTNLILLNSISSRFPQGLGTTTDCWASTWPFITTGHISAEYNGFLDTTTDGRRPTGAYMPGFATCHQDKDADFLRVMRQVLRLPQLRPAYRRLWLTLKKNLNGEARPWHVGSHMMGETIPKKSTR